MLNQQPPDRSQAELAAVLLATQQQSAQMRQKLLDYVARLWRSLGSWRKRDIAQFTKHAVPAVAGVQQRMSALTAASLAQQLHIVSGAPFRPVVLDPSKSSGAALRNGTAPDEVYERPFHVVWQELADLPHDDGAIDKAIEAGLVRAQKLAATDLQLAKRHAATAALNRDDKALGVRRVLEGDYSCALCIVASTLRYRLDTFRERGNIMRAIHPGCDCGWAVIRDPSEIYRSDSGYFTVDSTVQLGDGRTVPVAKLPDVHRKISSTFGGADAGAREFGVTGSKGKKLMYRDVIVTHEHGEMGDVLAVRGQHFTGPSDIPQYR